MHGSPYYGGDSPCYRKWPGRLPTAPARGHVVLHAGVISLGQGWLKPCKPGPMPISRRELSVQASFTGAAASSRPSSRIRLMPLLRAFSQEAGKRKPHKARVVTGSSVAASANSRGNVCRQACSRRLSGLGQSYCRAIFYYVAVRPVPRFRRQANGRPGLMRYGVATMVICTDVPPISSNVGR